MDEPDDPTTSTARPSAGDLGPLHEIDPVLEVAADLFATEGLVITFRWLQKDTGVPAEQLVERFGTIDGLLSATLRYQLGRIWAEFEPTLPTFDPSVFSSETTRRYWRVMTRAALAGRDVASLQGQFPAIENHTRQLLAMPDATTLSAAQLGAAESMAMMLGWVLLEDFLVPAAKLDGLTTEQIRADVFTTMQHVGRWRARRPAPDSHHA